MTKNNSNKSIREIAFEENAYAIWRNALYFLKTNFLGKIITFHFDMDAKQQTITIGFQKQHFAHLAGIRYEKNANSFWNDVEKKHINYSQIRNSSQSENIFRNKLQALKEIEQIIQPGVRITGSYNGDLLKADNIIITQNRKLGFAAKRTTNTSILVSTLNFGKPNKHQRKNGFTGVRVHKITSFEPKTGAFKVIIDDHGQQ